MTGPRGQRDRDHQRQDDGVLPGQLEEDDHRGDRGTRRSGQGGTHADQPVGAGGLGGLGPAQVCQRTEGTAGHRADEQRGRKHSAGPADTDGQAGREHLGDHQQQQEADHVSAFDGVLQHRVADPVHLRHRQQQQAQQQSTRCGAGPFRPAPEPVAEILDQVQHPRERDAHRADQDTERRIEQVLGGAVHTERGQRQKQFVAQDRPRDDGRGHAGEHHRTERLRGEVAQDQLHREERPGQWGVEGGRDAARGAARQQQPHPGGVQPQPLGHTRPDRRADLHDRPFAADRASAADAQRRGQRFDQSDLGGDPTAAHRHRVHDLRNPVAAGLRGEAVHERAVDQSGHRGHHHQESDAEPREVFAGHPTQSGVVLMSGEQPGESVDQRSKRHRPQPGTHTHHDGEGHQRRGPLTQPMAQLIAQGHCCSMQQLLSVS